MDGDELNINILHPQFDSRFRTQKKKNYYFLFETMYQCFTFLSGI